jgi:hypothetical protein
MEFTQYCYFVIYFLAHLLRNLISPIDLKTNLHRTKKSKLVFSSNCILAAIKLYKIICIFLKEKILEPFLSLDLRNYLKAHASDPLHDAVIGPDEHVGKLVVTHFAPLLELPAVVVEALEARDAKLQARSMEAIDHL